MEHIQFCSLLLLLVKQQQIEQQLVEQLQVEQQLVEVHRSKEQLIEQQVGHRNISKVKEERHMVEHSWVNHNMVMVLMWLMGDVMIMGYCSYKFYLKAEREKKI